MNIKRFKCSEKNFLHGRAHFQVEAIVIHIIDGSQVGADSVFASDTLTDRRSAHYSIAKTGEVHQYVDETDTAYHCGVVVRPTWAGLKKSADGAIVNPNFYTIGIEHEGRADDDWPDAMYQASGELLRSIASRFPVLMPLNSTKVVLHRQIRATKTCPGSKFSLARLLQEVDGTTDDVRAVRARSAVNVRRGAPSTSAPIVRVIPPDEITNVQASVTGESVRGISLWFQTVDDDFIWSGAVE